MKGLNAVNCLNIGYLFCCFPSSKWHAIAGTSGRVTNYHGVHALLYQLGGKGRTDSKRTKFWRQNKGNLVLLWFFKVSLQATWQKFSIPGLPWSFWSHVSVCLPPSVHLWLASFLHSTTFDAIASTALWIWNGFPVSQCFASSLQFCISKTKQNKMPLLLFMPSYWCFLQLWWQRLVTSDIVKAARPFPLQCPASH